MIEAPEAPRRVAGCCARLSNPAKLEWRRSMKSPSLVAALLEFRSQLQWTAEA